MALLMHSPDIAKVLLNPSRRAAEAAGLRRGDYRIRSVRVTRADGANTPAVALAFPGGGDNVRVHGQFSAPVKSRSEEEEEEKQNYYMNVGYAIRTLREEVPSLFNKELTFDIYTLQGGYYFQGSACGECHNGQWIVHGIPRVLWESRGRFDGTSKYKLDKDGKIYQHKVDNIAINSPPRFQVLAVAELIQSFGCPSMPKPTYFKVSSSSLEQE